MDSPDVTAITKIVKKVGTEFKSASDEDISFWIDLQAPVISKKKFGADYNLAVSMNFLRGIATWCYFDEFHVLLRDRLSLFCGL